MEIIDSAVTPSARGEIHGETLRDRIRDALDHWEAATMAGLGPKAPRSIDQYCEEFLSDTELLQQAQALTPDLVTELYGVAEGAEQPFARMAVYNLMDEQWWRDADLKAPPPGCSLVAQKVSGGHVLAQNMDLPGHMDGSQIALRLGGDDIPETIVLSAAGLLGLTGANADGLAVGVNTLLMLQHSASGLPVAFALRHALAASNPAVAMKRLSSMNHASGQHYAMVSSDQILSVECSARSTTVVPLEDAAQLRHTNHPLASPDIDPRALKRLGNGGFTKSSELRLAWLDRHCTGLESRADVQALFDDTAAPLCMRPETNGGSSTFASVLYALGDILTVRMRAGVAWLDDWSEFGFS